MVAVAAGTRACKSGFARPLRLISLSYKAAPAQNFATKYQARRLQLRPQKASTDDKKQYKTV